MIVEASDSQRDAVRQHLKDFYDLGGDTGSLFVMMWQMPIAGQLVYRKQCENVLVGAVVNDKCNQAAWKGGNGSTTNDAIVNFYQDDVLVKQFVGCGYGVGARTIGYLRFNDFLPDDAVVKW